MPANIVENFGNASGVTVPTCICYNLGNELVNGMRKLCLAGFGVGLTWSSIYMEVGHLNFNRIIDF
jgi:3-oxoacyl-[acyl-carrier-protein] synthase-3